MKVLTTEKDIWQGEMAGSYSGYTADLLRQDLAEVVRLQERIKDAEAVLDKFERAIRDGSDARLYQEQIVALDDLDFYRLKYPACPHGNAHKLHTPSGYKCVLCEPGAK